MYSQFCAAFAAKDVPLLTWSATGCAARDTVVFQKVQVRRGGVHWFTEQHLFAGFGVQLIDAGAVRTGSEVGCPIFDQRDEKCVNIAVLAADTEICLTAAGSARDA